MFEQASDYLELVGAKTLRAQYKLDARPANEVFRDILFERGYSKTKKVFVTREEAESQGIEDARWRDPGIVDARADRSWVTSGLAKALKVSNGVISTWLKGDDAISQKHWKRMAEVLHLTPQERFALFASCGISKHAYALEEIFTHCSEVFKKEGELPAIYEIGPAVMDSLCVVDKDFRSWGAVLAEATKNPDILLEARRLEKKDVRQALKGQNISITDPTIHYVFYGPVKKTEATVNHLRDILGVFPDAVLDAQQKATLHIACVSPLSFATKGEIFRDHADRRRKPKNTGQICYELMASHALIGDRAVSWHEIMKRIQSGKEIQEIQECQPLNGVTIQKQIDPKSTTGNRWSKWIRGEVQPRKGFIGAFFGLGQGELDFLEKAPQGAAAKDKKIPGHQGDWEQRLARNGRQTTERLYL